MLLVIDVGNTNFVLGLYKKEKLVKCWRMTTGGNRTADETGIFIHGLFDAAGIDAGKVEAVIISSVVPDIMYSLTQGIRKYFNIEPMIVGVGMTRNPSALTVSLTLWRQMRFTAALLLSLITAQQTPLMSSMKKANLSQALSRPAFPPAQRLCIRRRHSCRKSKLRHRSPSLRKTLWTAFRQGLCWGISGRRNISSSS